MTLFDLTGKTAFDGAVLLHVWTGGRGQGVFCANAALMYSAYDPTL